MVCRRHFLFRATVICMNGSFLWEIGKCNIHWVFGHVGVFVFFQDEFSWFWKICSLFFCNRAPFDFWYMFFVFDKKADFGKRLTRITKPGRDVAHQKKSRVISKTTTTKVGDFGTAKWRKQKDPKEIGGNVSLLEAFKKTHGLWEPTLPQSLNNGFLWFVGTHVAKKSL